MAKTVSQMLAIKPPAGFKWVGVEGTLLATLDNNRIVGWIEGLYKWAKENDVGLTPTEHMYVSNTYHDAYVWYGFKATPDAFKPTTVRYFGDGTFSPGCGHKHKVGEWYCARGGNGKRTLVCQGCYRGGLVTRKVERSNGATIHLCGTCVTECTKCKTNPVYTAERSRFKGDAKDQCETCCPVFRCQGCNNVKAEAEGKHVVTYSATATKFTICGECKDTGMCGECGLWCGTSKKHAMIDGVRHCELCSTKKADKVREKHEKFDPDELPSTGNIVIPALPERPFRPISIETEVDGDRKYISNTLYNCGIVRVPDVEAYGTPPPETSKWAAFLKHDGSVTGGELISYLLQLNETAHADAFLNTLSKVRSLEKVGKVQFNSNCGGHIHIDAHNFDSGNVWRLLTIWNFLEDVIYRLAGAGHAYGHRTQDPEHDRANRGGGYANVPAKGPWGVKTNVTRAIQAQGRMCGLNFKPYLGQIAACRCGAYQQDAMRKCTCSLGRCTIEWRVWNSQGNPRILHAWIAFMQAMHAYADVDDEPTAAFEADHPTLQWTNKKFSSTPFEHRSAVKVRLEWIFKNLVLTEAERDSLIYTIKQTDMKSLGTVYIEGLRNIEGPKNVAPRPNQTPKVRRTKKIVIEAPKAGSDPLVELSPEERERVAYQRRRGVARFGQW